MSRFIPARAGNAASARRSPSWLTVHPRACGERGIRARAVRLGLRFIPARAGNALPSIPSGGSSPRVRGTLRLGLRFIPARAGNAALIFLSCAASNRFIPARAGNAHLLLGRPVPVALNAVHPRACGERIRTCGYVLSPMSRFIPARAGNAVACPAVTDVVRRPVHPRACGERVMLPPSREFSTGSSPRVRGTRQVGAPSPNFSVHPRACGERSSHKKLTYKAFRNVKECTVCSSFILKGQVCTTRQELALTFLYELHRIAQA